MSRAHRGPSEAQINADALANRGRTYADPNAASFRVSWDAGKRAPRDLRHAVELVRRAYRDEVPTKLHSGQELADDGTPKMTARFEAYIVGADSWTDAGKDEPLVSFFLTPFRARLEEMEHHGAESVRKHAAIVKHVTIGGQTGEGAAQTEGVPVWCSRLVAFEAIATFLRGLTDIRVDARAVA